VPRIEPPGRFRAGESNRHTTGPSARYSDFAQARSKPSKGCTSCSCTPQLTFPDDKDCPPHLFEGADSGSVSLSVRRNLCPPELDVRLRKRRETATAVLMPKAPVNEYCRPPTWKHHIRSSRQISSVESVPKSVRMEPSPDYQFGLGVLSTDSRHERTALGSTHHVGHRQLLPRTSKSRDAAQRRLTPMLYSPLRAVSRQSQSLVVVLLSRGSHLP
jgi:hypothetical protein